MKSKKTKTSRNQAHTAKSPQGMGDFYGTGVRQKMGTLRDSYIYNKISPKKLGKPPKSLA